MGFHRVSIALPLLKVRFLSLYVIEKKRKLRSQSNKRVQESPLNDEVEANMEPLNIVTENPEAHRKPQVPSQKQFKKPKTEQKKKRVVSEVNLSP